MIKPRTSLDNEWKLISYIEDLSNEIFYEIFDYLDGFDLFKAFLNLNVRFQCLRNSILIRLNPSFSSCMQSNYENRLINVISSTRQRILAIFSYEKWMTSSFYALLTIDSSFHRLESLFLVGLNSYRLISLLTSLTTLYNLSSLTIVIDEDILDLTETYRMLCSLPTLKYFKLSFETEEMYSSLAIVTNDHFSNLKYLLRNHSCTFIGLTSILSCTPQLCFLNCMILNEPSDSIKEYVKIALSNLTSIKIVHPYTKRWHELDELNGNHHFYYIEQQQQQQQQQQSVIVTISERFHRDSEDFFFSNFHPVLTTFQ
ncbi:unnamed protein product, partial [Rotaria magnacalcarata]